jgi:hypothetical protein
VRANKVNHNFGGITSAVCAARVKTGFRGCLGRFEWMLASDQSVGEAGTVMKKGSSRGGDAAEPLVFRTQNKSARRVKIPAGEPVVNHARLQTTIPDKH